MAQWGDIQTLVGYNLGRSGDSNVNTLLPLWADSFQLEAQMDRNYWFLKTVASRAIGASAQSYPLPSDFKDGMMFYIVQQVANGDRQDAFIELDQITDLDVVRTYSPVSVSSEKAQPETVVIGDETVTFWPWPDKAYTVKTQYWKDIAPPVASSPVSFVNTWITKYPALYEAALTKRGFLYLQDKEGAMIWGAREREILGSLRAAWVARELGMGGKQLLVPKMDVYGTTRQSQNSTWRVYN